MTTKQKAGFPMADIAPKIKKAYVDKHPFEPNKALRQAVKGHKPTKWYAILNVLYVVIAVGIITGMAYCFTHHVGY